MNFRIPSLSILFEEIPRRLARSIRMLKCIEIKYSVVGLICWIDRFESSFSLFLSFSSFSSLFFFLLFSLPSLSLLTYRRYFKEFFLYFLESVEILFLLTFELQDSLSPLSYIIIRNNNGRVIEFTSISLSKCKRKGRRKKRYSMWEIRTERFLSNGFTDFSLKTSSILHNVGHEKEQNLVLFRPNWP